MATYIHKHGPDTGTIVIQDYELGISDVGYGYTSLGGNVQKIKSGFSDISGSIDFGSGPINGSEIFFKTGQDQTVSDTNVNFSGTVNVTTKVVCPTFEGTATKAKYADLAENYESDIPYNPGTVLYIGSDTEVSVNGEAVAGIVSDKPGYLLNSEPDAKIYVPIALKGRVPVKVSKDCKRGDILVADRENPGFAKPNNDASGLDILGVCIKNSLNGLAEIKV